MTDSPLSRVQAYLRDTEGMPGLDHEMIAGFIDGTGRTGRLFRSDLAALVAELLAVCALHRQVETDDDTCCAHDHQLWPCPTIKALEASHA